MGKIYFKIGVIAIGSVIVGACVWGMYFCWIKQDPLEENCAFCKQEVLDAQTFYEGQYAVVLYTHKPIEEGHSLIIPKRHVQFYQELTAQEQIEMSALVSKVHSAVSKVFGTKDYLLLQKNGAQAGQSVPHVHIHYIPQSGGKASVIRFAWRMIKANLQSPLEKTQIDGTLKRLKEAMKESEVQSA